METTPHTTENTPPAETENSAEKSRTGMTLALAAVACIAVLGGGYLYLSHTTGGQPFSALPFSVGTDAVARVNGEEISGAEYEENLANMRTTLEGQGADLSNAELVSAMEDQVLNSLIEGVLLNQAAVNGGFTASESDVQGEYDALAAQLGGAEALKSQMASVGLTEEKLRKNIGTQIGIRAYLTANLDPAALAVSEEEITAFYDGVQMPEGQEKPTLTDVRAQIEAQLKQQKEQAAISAVVEKLKSEATIEVLI